MCGDRSGTAACLASNGRSHQVFRLPWYRWIDIWRYPIAIDCEDRDLLRSMIDSEEYQYSYIAPWPSPTLDGRPVHGPYWLADLAPSSYRGVDEHHVRSTVETILDYADDDLRLDDLRLDDVLGDVLVAANSYRLDHGGLTPIDPGIGGSWPGSTSASWWTAIAGS